MRVYRLFSFCIIPLHVILHASNLSFVSLPHTLTFKHTEIKHNRYKIIISFFHHMFCYTKYWFIIQNNKKEEFRFFRRMNMISGSQLSFVIHWVWCIQHQMSLLQILYWSFSLSHNSLNSLHTVLIRNEALWDIKYSERLWCQIS